MSYNICTCLFGCEVTVGFHYYNTLNSAGNMPVCRLNNFTKYDGSSKPKRNAISFILRSV